MVNRPNSNQYFAVVAAWHANCIYKGCCGRAPIAGRLSNTTRSPQIGIYELRAFNTRRRARTSFGRRSTRRCRHRIPAPSRSAFAEQSAAPLLATGAARRPPQCSRPGHRCKQIRGAGRSGIPNPKRNYRVRAVQQLHHDRKSVGSPLHPEGSELQNRPVYAGSPDT